MQLDPLGRVVKSGEATATLQHLSHRERDGVAALSQPQRPIDALSIRTRSSRRLELLHVGDSREADVLGELPPHQRRPKLVDEAAVEEDVVTIPERLEEKSRESELNDTLQDLGRERRELAGSFDELKGRRRLSFD